MAELVKFKAEARKDGESFGFTGAELAKYMDSQVDKWNEREERKQQADRDAAEKQAAREAAEKQAAREAAEKKADREAAEKQAEREAEAAKRQAEREAEAAEKQAAREAEKAAREEAIRKEKADREHALELEKMRIEFEKAKLTLQQPALEAQTPGTGGLPSAKFYDDEIRFHPAAKDFPFYPYKEKWHTIDRYLEEFELFVRHFDLPEDDWNIRLARALVDNDYEAYRGMCANDIISYPALKSALRKRYKPTAAKYNRRPRNSVDEKWEIVDLCCKPIQPARKDKENRNFAPRKNRKEPYKYRYEPAKDRPVTEARFDPIQTYEESVDSLFAPRETTAEPFNDNDKQDANDKPIIDAASDTNQPKNQLKPCADLKTAISNEQPNQVVNMSPHTRECEDEIRQPPVQPTAVTVCSNRPCLTAPIQTQLSNEALDDQPVPTLVESNLVNGTIDHCMNDSRRSYDADLRRSLVKPADVTSDTIAVQYDNQEAEPMNSPIAQIEEEGEEYPYAPGISIADIMDSPTHDTSDSLYVVVDKPTDPVIVASAGTINLTPPETLEETPSPTPEGTEANQQSETSLSRLPTLVERVDKPDGRMVDFHKPGSLCHRTAGEENQSQLNVQKPLQKGMKQIEKVETLSGHLGNGVSLNRIGCYRFWPGITKEIKQQILCRSQRPLRSPRKTVPRVHLGKASEDNQVLYTPYFETHAYHPEVNGLVERDDSSLVSMLRRIKYGRPEKWDTHPPEEISAYCMKFASTPIDSWIISKEEDEEKHRRWRPGSKTKDTSSLFDRVKISEGTELPMNVMKPYEETIEEASTKKLLLWVKKRVFKKQEKITYLIDLLEQLIESRIDSKEIMEKQSMAANQEDRKSDGDQRCIQSNLPLVSQDHKYISVAINDLWQEITDPVNLNKDEDITIVSVDTTLSDQEITVLAHALERVPIVKEELEEVLEHLTIKVDMLDINLESCAYAAQPVLLQLWLKGSRLKRQPDENKLYSRTQGKSPDEEKTSRLREAPRPCTKSNVRSFLGTCGYYQKFIPRFNLIAGPLSNLTRKDQPEKVIWNSGCEAAFNTLKEMLTAQPILQLPDLSKAFILRTDASYAGLGAVLLQSNNSDPPTLFPIAYASRKLSTSEANYATVELECLAIVWAVEKFQPYLYGKHFTLQTDHRPLSFLSSAKTLNARLMRWSLLLQPYSFEIEYIPGKTNFAPDFLSRHPVSGNEPLKAGTLNVGAPEFVPSGESLGGIIVTKKKF